tara:strand:+ start:1114 stop:1896 length:783 start_codon:yes stop_codon:yes gene_type:complete
MKVKPKKYLGQHFLNDLSIAQKISDTLSLNGYKKVLEIGPGTGVLTNNLLKKPVEVFVIEIDSESVNYLKKYFNIMPKNIIEADVLKYDFKNIFGDEQFAITGNFPYNISTQIVFKLLQFRKMIPEFTGMFQKEVAQRICVKEGTKTYGILSVLVQAFYKADYLFSVSPEVFTPPPKVDSGVLRLKRKNNFILPCDEKLFFKVVKTAFQQRRKTLRNSLKILDLSDNLKANTIFDKRPEHLSVESFVNLTHIIEKDKIKI